MTEITGNVEVEYEDDVEIDFLFLTDAEKLDVIDAVINGNEYTFMQTPLCYSGEVTIDTER